MAVAQKIRYQNGTLVSGHIDQHLRNPSCLILSHTHMATPRKRHARVLFRFRGRSLVDFWLVVFLVPSTERVASVSSRGGQNWLRLLGNLLQKVAPWRHHRPKRGQNGTIFQKEARMGPSSKKRPEWDHLPKRGRKG